MSPKNFPGFKPTGNSLCTLSSSTMILWGRLQGLFNSAMEDFLQGKSPSAYTLVTGIKTQCSEVSHTGAGGANTQMPNFHPSAAVCSHQQGNGKGSNTSKCISMRPKKKTISPKTFWEHNLHSRPGVASWVCRACFPPDLGSSMSCRNVECSKGAKPFEGGALAHDGSMGKRQLRAGKIQAMNYLKRQVKEQGSQMTAFCS